MNTQWVNIQGLKETCMYMYILLYENYSPNILHLCKCTQTGMTYTYICLANFIKFLYIFLNEKEMKLGRLYAQTHIRKKKKKNLRHRHMHLHTHDLSVFKSEKLPWCQMFMPVSITNWLWVWKTRGNQKTLQSNWEM